MKIMKTLALGALIAASWLALGTRPVLAKPEQGASGPRTVIHLNQGWKFANGDQPGAEAVKFEDRSWRAVSIPHDWSIEGTFDKDANATPHADFTKWVVWRKGGAQAYLPRGIGWYRMEFDQAALAPGQKALLYFEGVYRESDVWLNGQPLGHHASGYTSFFYDITPVLKSGRNVLAVRCDARLKEGWWYEACGIYRPVQLLVTDKLSVPPWGVWVSTPEITAEKAIARVKTTVRNEHADARKVSVSTRIVDASGAEIGGTESAVSLEPGQSHEVSQEIAVPSPRLWSPDQPYLYRAVTQLKTGARLVDTTSTTFGIRSFHFDSELGFFLNGKPTKLWGAANHMDIAALGGALPPRVCFENTRVLKDSGANFLRGAHNPRTPAELHAADLLGICVASETRYFDDSEFGLESLREMILRDRNHPSIIMWSLGNEEVGRQGTPAGVEIAKKMIAVVREMDPYRAASLAQNHEFNKPCGFSDMFDVLGINWRGQDDVLEDHIRFPKRAMYTSEYNYDGSWDRYAGWPWMAGAACWGGFEYYGEDSWPNKTWPGQIADVCHEPTTRFHQARAQWGKQPMVWVENTWTGEAGKAVTLRGFTNCEQVDVSVNGQMVKTVLQPGGISPKAQYWRIQKVANGRSLLLAADGRALRFSDLKLANADPESAEQHWQLVERADESVALQAGDGSFLNVFGASGEEASSVQLFRGQGTAGNERWRIQTVADGAVRLAAVHSGKCLTLAGPDGGLMQYSAAQENANAPAFVSTNSARLSASLPFVPSSKVRLEGRIGGKVVATQELSAPEAASRLILETTATALRNDGMDIALLRCGIADRHGNIIRSVDRPVRITVSGAGSFAASGNACRDVTKTGGTPVTSPETSTFNGLCQFAVRSGFKTGVLVARVQAEGLEPAELKIPVSAQADPLAVATKPEGERLPAGGDARGYSVRNLAISSSRIASGEVVSVQADVANLASTYPVEVVLTVDQLAPIAEKFSVPLAGERNITVPLPKLYAEGEHAVTVSLRRNAQEIESRKFVVTVQPTAISMKSEALGVTPYVTSGGTVEVTATVRNVGSRKAEALQVPVLLNGQQAAAPTITLAPGETGQISASFAAPEGERHQVSVAGASSEVVILKPFKAGEGMEVIGSPSKVSGKNGKALKLSGNKEFITIAPVDLKEKSFTIWMRCKLDALDPESKEGPLFSGGKHGPQTAIRGGFHHDKVLFSVWGDRNLESAAKVQPGQWLELAFVLEAKYTPKQTGVDGADLQPAFWTARHKIYINGKQEADAEGKVYLGDLTQIGAFWSNPKSFNGVIEEVKVYPAALTAEQIKAGASDSAGSPVKPQVWLNFNE